MAQNTSNVTPDAIGYLAGDGIDITGGVISNTMLPPSAILDNTVTNPAAITDFGGAYIVPATGATGAWAGQANQIATTTDNGVTWQFTVPAAQTRRQVIGGTNAGTIYRWSGTAWTPAVAGGQPTGTILKTQLFVGAEITATATTNFSATTMSATYTPVSSNSFLIVEADADYSINGFGADAWRTRVIVAGAWVATKTQRFDGGGAGGGTRGGTALPTIARYRNATTAAKVIQVILERAGGDDAASLSTSDRWIKVTEIQR